DKSLRIIGLGDPVIRPTSLPESRPSLITGRPVTAGILIDGGRTVLKDLVLDLDQNSAVACTPVLTGIYFRNAGGVVETSRVRGVRFATLPACESGVGIYVESGPIGERIG